MGETDAASPDCRLLGTALKSLQGRGVNLTGACTGMRIWGNLWKEHVLQGKEKGQSVARGQTVVVFKHAHTPLFKRWTLILSSCLGRAQ